MVEKYTSPKSSAIRQLNDELEQGILRSVENNPLVALGLDRVGVEQMTTLFEDPLAQAEFDPAGFSKERLKKLGHVGGSPVDFDKPSVKGMIFDGEIFTSDQFDKIANLPSKEQLLSKLVGMLNSPMSKLSSVLNSSVSGLLGKIPKVTSLSMSAWLFAISID